MPPLPIILVFLSEKNDKNLCCNCNTTVRVPQKIIFAMQFCFKITKEKQIAPGNYKDMSLEYLLH